jgi:ABC-type proline/glycine betaine transport system substrate-binding protein
MTHDCSNVQNSIIKKLAWIKLPTVLPCVYSFIKKIQLNNQMLAEAAALVKYDNLSEDAAAKFWLEKYSKDLKSWSSTHA